MKHHFIKLQLLLLIFIIVGCNSKNKNTNIDQPQIKHVDSTRVMSWEKYMAVEEQHKLLSNWEGNWVGDVTIWMEPKSEPTKNITEIKRTSVLGGRFIESIFSSNFMDMPFEGFTIIGYNNSTKIFEQYAADNMGTGIMTYEGKWNAASNSIDFIGKSTDPINGKDVTIKETIKIIDDNTIISENYVPDSSGNLFRTMQVIMKRVD